jgi:fibronectin type 3 domain-containing protein
LRRALRLPVAVLAVLFFGIVGVVLLRVAASGKPHSVLLKWNPPDAKPGVTVTGYNIYRSQLDGTFKPIASGVTAASYVDRNVRSGAFYRYFVKAVDAAGHESPPSDPASAVIP